MTDAALDKLTAMWREGEISNDEFTLAKKYLKAEQARSRSQRGWIGLLFTRRTVVVISLIAVLFVVAPDLWPTEHSGGSRQIAHRISKRGSTVPASDGGTSNGAYPAAAKASAPSVSFPQNEVRASVAAVSEPSREEGKAVVELTSGVSADIGNAWHIFDVGMPEADGSSPMCTSPDAVDRFMSWWNERLHHKAVQMEECRLLKGYDQTDVLSLVDNIYMKVRWNSQQGNQLILFVPIGRRWQNFGR